jgi:hypothetical protein
MLKTGFTLAHVSEPGVNLWFTHSGKLVVYMPNIYANQRCETLLKYNQNLLLSQKSLSRMPNWWCSQNNLSTLSQVYTEKARQLQYTDLSFTRLQSMASAHARTFLSNNFAHLNNCIMPTQLVFVAYWQFLTLEL